MATHLQIGDLKRVYIRARNADGHWDSLSVDQVSDQEFDNWAHTKRNSIGNRTTWTLQERAEFCDELWQRGELVLLTDVLYQ